MRGVKSRVKVRCESFEPNGKGLPIVFTRSSVRCTERSSAASPVLRIIRALKTRPSRRMVTDTLAMRERASPLGIRGSHVRRYTPTTRLAYEVKAALLAPSTFTLIAAESWRNPFMSFIAVALILGIFGCDAVPPIFRFTTVVLMLLGLLRTGFFNGAGFFGVCFLGCINGCCF